MFRRFSTCELTVMAFSFTAGIAQAQPNTTGCSALPNQGTLKAALDKATAEEKSGLNNHMWATVVDKARRRLRGGIFRLRSLCAVGGEPRDFGAEGEHGKLARARFDVELCRVGPGNRPCTVNGESAIPQHQPGGSLFGLQESNPVNTAPAYNVPYSTYGTTKDPLVNHRIGGINVFGGGLALYARKRVVGGVGVSGDTSCADQ